MSRFIKHFEKAKRLTKSIYNSSKIKAQIFASDFNGKFHTLKDYTKSDLFEDDIDQVILRLQMFDTDLVVPNMDKLNRNQRVAKKVKLIKASFRRLNIDFAPIGMLAGSVFGPKGTAVGAPLGSYIFGACIVTTIYERIFSTSEVVMAPAST